MIPSICNASIIREAGGENVAFCSKVLTSLQPATRYAVYVESKTLFSQRGAISNIVYFTTNPSSKVYLVTVVARNRLLMVLLLTSLPFSHFQLQIHRIHAWRSYRR